MNTLAIGLATIAIAVTLLNLLVLFAVIRRLRSLQEQLTQGSTPDAPAVGTTIDEYTANTIGGGTLTRRDLDGDSLVAFFSPGCPPCKEMIARFAADPAALPAQTYAFVVGNDLDPDARQYVADLAGVATRTAYVEPDSPVLTAFGGVAAFPTVLRIAGGTVAASGHALDEVLTPELVRA